MKIRAICFDLGKVLIDFDWQIFLRRVAEKSPYTPEEITARMKADPQMLQYEIGRIRSSDFFQHQKQWLQFSESPEELRACFSEIFSPLTENIKLASELSALYPLAIISNTNEAHIHQVRRDYRVLDFFPVLIFSHEVHTMKPKPEIYVVAQEGLIQHTKQTLAPGEILFIDDLEPNVLGASQLGWQTLHLQPETNLREAMVSLNLLH